MIKNENNNEIELLKSRLDYLFNFLYLVIDQNEFDLISFLHKKETYKYIIFFITKIIFGLIFYIFLFLVIIVLPNFLALFFYIIAITSFFLYFIIDYLAYKKFRYSLSHYHRQRKKLISFRYQLELLLNNHLLTESLKESKMTIYKEEFIRVNEKIELINKIFKPYTEYFNKFGIIALIPIILSFILALYDKYFQNPVQIENFELIIQLISVVPLILLAVFSSILINRVSKARYYSDKINIFEAEKAVKKLILETELELLNLRKSEKYNGV